MDTVKIYVLWYQSLSDCDGWPTMEPSIDKVYTHRADALNGLDEHNRKYPYDKNSMSVRAFRVAIPQKKANRG